MLGRSLIVTAAVTFEGWPASEVRSIKAPALLVLGDTAPFAWSMSSGCSAFSAARPSTAAWARFRRRSLPSFPAQPISTFATGRTFSCLS
jgi:hypothetical protein